MYFHENTRWFKDRFQSMGPGEAISRLADFGRHVALRASLKSLKNRYYRRFKPTDCSHKVPEIQKQLDDMSARTREAVITTASRWLEHRASFFSLKDVPLGGAIDWHRDYSSGIVAPIRYSGLINQHDTSKVGDIKYIWEPNRLQHLVLLALARLWTGNAKYWGEIERQVVSWKKHNPFMMGVNWKSPLEAAMRLISWAYVSFIAGGWKQDITHYNTLLAETVYQHQYFIRKFYSKNSSANNHLIGEMAGLYVGSVFWPWYEESDAWRAFARRKLLDEIARQVEPDGVGTERATEYQMFVLECFVLAGSLGQAIGDPFPREYWERVNRMKAFLLAISNRSGDFPLFGDGDGGQVIALAESTVKRARALTRIGQLREACKSPDLRSVLLLWGQRLDEMPLGVIDSRTRSLKAFPAGGYYVLATNHGSDDEIIIVFDAGPLGLPPLNAHGHSDALSFWLSYGGQEFLIDPGTYCYHGSSLWRSYFRGTAAHNTVRIDGQDQSVSAGTFLWRDVANCQAVHIEKNAELICVEGVHDGYRRLADPIGHRRTMRLLKKSGALIITDHLECCNSHDIEIVFHFAETCRIQQIGFNYFEVLNCDKRLSIQVDSRLKSQLYRGCEGPIFGWVSRRFGVKEPCFTLVARAGITGSTSFVTEIIPA